MLNRHQAAAWQYAVGFRGMTDQDFRVEVVGHATLRVQSGGRTLVTDPWLVDPIGCNSGFHFPPLVHDPADLAAQTDAIYISHIHPDHFNPPTLEFFSKDTPIYIGNYRRKEFRDAVRQLGFPVIEVPFQETIGVDGTDFEIALVEHDYEESAAYDSSIVIRTPEFTVFENNDCFLRPGKYVWVREHFTIDYAFLGYSPASFFPINFEMDAQDKARLLAEAGERRYKDFLEAAQLLAPKLAIPFASGARFLLEAALWKNVAFNSATEALRRLNEIDLEGAVLGPGDRILPDGSIRRVSAVLDKQQELAAIEAHARRVQSWVVGFQKQEPPARADLVERFRDYILRLWRDTKDKLPGVRGHVIAYVLVGPEEQRFYFDFSKPEDQIFQWGEPARYDMRYTYPSSGLQSRLDGEIDWDQLHFTNDVSVHQISYAKEFYMMLRSEMLDLR
jgi:L-ascorbate metabolism protein UlaG (beta-lactamase superfamily)